MAETKIEWTDKTWNPVTGCTKKSEGCVHCYAEVMARRLKGMGQVKYNERPSVIIYKQLARCDNADSELGTDPMHIYMEPGTSKTDNPGYGNYYSLPTAATIFERLGKSDGISKDCC